MIDIELIAITIQLWDNYSINYVTYKIIPLEETVLA